MKWAVSTNTLLKAIRKYDNQGKLTGIFSGSPVEMKLSGFWVNNKKSRC